MKRSYMSLFDNTDIDIWMEGVFSCGICEEEYGDCTNCRGTEECERRYKDWCRQI